MSGEEERKGERNRGSMEKREGEGRRGEKKIQRGK